MAPTARPAPPGAQGRSGRTGARARWGALAAVCLATLVMLVDFMAVSVALPALHASTGASFDQLQWVLEAFVVALAAFVLTAGYIADLVGRRPVFLTGLAVFTIGSLVCGFASSPYAIIGGRVVQGLGGAFIFSTGTVLLTETFRLKAGPLALAIWGTATGLAVALSPLVGGVVSSYLGWQWIFFLEAAAAVLALVVGARYVTEPRGPLAGHAGAGHAGAGRREPGETPSAPDWRGLALFSAAIAILVIGLVDTTTGSTTSGGWTSSGVLACFACSALLLVAFIAHEWVTPAPMLDISLFKQRTFTGSSIAAFGLSMAVLGPFMFLVLYLSYDLGYSELWTGTSLLLLTGMTLPLLPFTQQLDRYVPAKVLICGGLSLVALGLWLMSLVTAGRTWGVLVPGLLVAGIGLELVNPRLAVAAAATVKPHLAAVASRTSSAFRQLGTAIGVAVLGAVFATRLADSIGGAVSATPQLVQGGYASSITARVLDGHLLRAATSAPGGAQDVLPIVHAAFASAMHDVFLVAAVVALASAVLAVSVRSRDLADGLEGISPAQAVPGQAVPRPVGQSSEGRPAAEGAREVAAGPVPAGPVPAGPAGTGPSSSGPTCEPGHTPAPSAPTGVGQDRLDRPPPRPGCLSPAQSQVSTKASLAADHTEGGRRDWSGLVAAYLMSGTQGGGPQGGGPQGGGPQGGGPAASAGAPGNGHGGVIDLRPDRPRLRGQVTAATGEPLAGAVVTLVGPDGGQAAQAIASADGSFALNSPDEGTFTLVAAAPHYRAAASMVSLRPGEASTRLSLLGIGSLAGRVTRSGDGIPLTASIEVLSLGGSVAAKCRTDGDGSFILPDMLEGDYELAVGLEGYKPEKTSVAVLRGSTTVAEVALTGVGHVYGAVCSPSGGWLPGVPVTLSGSAGGLLETLTDSAGSYNFPNVAEGTYTLTANGTRPSSIAVVVGPGTVVSADITMREWSPEP